MVQLARTDAVVLVGYLAAVVLWGMWLGRGRQDSRRYLLGGRDAPWWAVLGSIVATETSTVTFLSVPGLAFAADGNLCFLQLSFGYIVGRILIVLWLLPMYFRGELFSAYEVLQHRFGGATQRTASLIFLLTRNLGDGLRLYLTAVVLEKTLGWSLSSCVVVIGAATILFTFVGGMKSVIWNDCLQLVVYMVGGLVAFAFIVGRLPDGLSGLLTFAQETGRLRLFDFRFDLTIAYTFWAGVVGGAFLTLGTHGTDQMMVQRSLAARSEADAGKALIASGIVVALQFTLFLFVGIALANFYALRPESAAFASGDHVFASYIINELPGGIGLVGLLLAAVFSAAMSTLSSSLNSSATALVKDWIIPLGTRWTDRGIVWLSRGLTIAFGLLQIAIGIKAQEADDIVINNALAIAGFAAGLLLGLFALGATRRVGQSAALIGLLVGCCCLIAIKFFPVAGYAIAWPWFSLIGSTVTFVVGLTASLAWPNSPRPSGQKPT